MKNLSVFVLFLFCLTFTLNGQVTTSGISGKVTAEGELLIGATVQAVHEPSGTTYGTVTNADGRYSLQGMRTGGPYTVEVSFMDFLKYFDFPANYRLYPDAAEQVLPPRQNDKLQPDTRVLMRVWA